MTKRGSFDKKARNLARMGTAFLLAASMLLAAGCAPREAAPISNADTSDPQAALGHSQSSAQEVREEEEPLPDTLMITTSTNQFAAGKKIIIKPSSSQSSEPAGKPASIKVLPVSGSQSGVEQSTARIPVPDELRGIWISYLDFNSLLKNQSSSAFQVNIANAFDQIASMGLNTVFVQVRPYGDALYQSQYFPWSHTVTGTEGKDPGFDPLSIMVKEAHQRGLRVEAWINPYRIRSGNSSVALSASNPAYKWLQQGDSAVIQYNGVISYNPASQKAQQLIADGVAEIVKGYDVDGIHFDDYFYPTTDAAFDQSSYKAYQGAGGTLSLAQWRRQNVDDLIKKVYTTVKAIDPSVQFGVSPQGNNDNNLNGQYVDVSKWLTGAGYVDYICPQIYFGYQNSTHPFSQTASQWNNMISTTGVRLYIGLAAYKLGTVDNWAGDGAGKTEWTSTSDILSRMVQTGRNQSHYGGFILFRYDSLFSASGTQIQREKQNLKAILK